MDKATCEKTECYTVGYDLFESITVGVQRLKWNTVTKQWELDTEAIVPDVVIIK